MKVEHEDERIILVQNASRINVGRAEIHVCPDDQGKY